jgi:hypothetical protein
VNLQDLAECLTDGFWDLGVSLANADGMTAAIIVERTVSELRAAVLFWRRQYIEGVVSRYAAVDMRTSNLALQFIETAVLISTANNTSINIAHAARRAIHYAASGNVSALIYKVGKDFIEADAKLAIVECVSREAIISTAGKAERAIRSIATAAADSLIHRFDSEFVTEATKSGTHPVTVYDAISLKDHWVNLCRCALRWYKASASLAITGLESFIVHLQGGGDEGGTAPLLLKEDYDESLFELGPNVIFTCLVSFSAGANP